MATLGHWIIQRHCLFLGHWLLLGPGYFWFHPWGLRMTTTPAQEAPAVKNATIFLIKRLMDVGKDGR